MQTNYLRMHAKGVKDGMDGKVSKISHAGCQQIRGVHKAPLLLVCKCVNPQQHVVTGLQNSVLLIILMGTSLPEAYFVRLPEGSSNRQ